MSSQPPQLPSDDIFHNLLPNYSRSFFFADSTNSPPDCHVLDVSDAHTAARSHPPTVHCMNSLGNIPKTTCYGTCFIMSEVPSPNLFEAISMDRGEELFVLWLGWACSLRMHHLSLL